MLAPVFIVVVCDAEADVKINKGDVDDGVTCYVSVSSSAPHSLHVI